MPQCVYFVPQLVGLSRGENINYKTGWFFKCIFYSLSAGAYKNVCRPQPETENDRTGKEFSKSCDTDFNRTKSEASFTGLDHFIPEQN